MNAQSNRGRLVARIASGLTIGVLALSPGLLQAQDAPPLINQMPKAQGTMPLLRWAAPFGEPPTLDPAKGADNSIYLVNYNVCDSLVRLGADYKKSPGLARSWEYAKDGTSLTFRIRQGVTFSDGSPLTAEDVRFSLARHMEPKLASLYRATVFPNVTNISVSGPDSVTVSFSRPDELFLNAMSTPAGLILKKEFVETAGTTYGSSQTGQTCTGPYRIEKWNAGANVILAANPNYWDPEFRPHAQKVDLRFIPDSVALTQALLSGAIDGSYEISPSAIAPLRAGGGAISFGPSPQMFHLYTVAPGPMADQRLRQAFSMLIDRTAIASKVFRGSAAPNYAMVPPILWDAEATTELRASYDRIKSKLTHDIAGARALIDKIPDRPKALTLVVLSGNEQMRLTATLIQQLASEVGITLTIKEIMPAQNASYFFDRNVRKGVDLIMNQGYSTAPDELFYPFRVVLPNGVFNLVGYDDATVTNLLTEARTKFNSKERSSIFIKAQELYEPAQVIIPMATMHEVSYLRNGLTGAITSYAYLFSPALARIGPK